MARAPGAKLLLLLLLLPALDCASFASRSEAGNAGVCDGDGVGSGGSDDGLCICVVSGGLWAEGLGAEPVAATDRGTRT
jgi:hypothetical protein